jgi:hypothetical protein
MVALFKIGSKITYTTTKIGHQEIIVDENTMTISRVHIFKCPDTGREIVEYIGESGDFEPEKRCFHEDVKNGVVDFVDL